MSGIVVSASRARAYARKIVYRCSRCSTMGDPILVSPMRKVMIPRQCPRYTSRFFSSFQRGRAGLRRRPMSSGQQLHRGESLLLRGPANRQAARNPRRRANRRDASAHFVRSGAKPGGSRDSGNALHDRRVHRHVRSDQAGTASGVCRL